MLPRRFYRLQTTKLAHSISGAAGATADGAATCANSEATEGGAKIQESTRKPAA